MVMVWQRGDPRHQTRFHRDQDCRQLAKAPAQGQSHELLAIDITEVEGRPCATCYPDAPRLGKILKRYCKVHGHRPCHHNGGIAIITRQGHQRWVWPDSNHLPYYRRHSSEQSA